MKLIFHFSIALVMQRVEMSAQGGRAWGKTYRGLRLKEEHEPILELVVWVAFSRQSKIQV